MTLEYFRFGKIVMARQFVSLRAAKGEQRKAVEAIRRAELKGFNFALTAGGKQFDAAVLSYTDRPLPFWGDVQVSERECRHRRGDGTRHETP